MGVHPNVGYDRFPKQGGHLGKRVRVCFDYDTERTILGRFIRDDREEPWGAVILLDDGRAVAPAECQYTLAEGE